MNVEGSQATVEIRCSPEVFDLLVASSADHCPVQCAMSHNEDMLQSLVLERQNLIAKESSCSCYKIIEGLCTIEGLIVLGVMQHVMHGMIGIITGLIDAHALARAEAEFDDSLVGNDLLCLGSASQHQTGRLLSTVEGTAINAVVRDDGPAFGCDTSQLTSVVVEGDVYPALETMHFVPIGLSVTKKIEFHLCMYILFSTKCLDGLSSLLELNTTTSLDEYRASKVLERVLIVEQLLHIRIATHIHRILGS